MKIVYRVSIEGRKPVMAGSGQELDKLLYEYYQTGGRVSDLTVKAVVVLG